MAEPIAAFWNLVIVSLRTPHEGAKAVLAVRLPVWALWETLVLLAIVSTVLTSVASAAIGVPGVIGAWLTHQPIPGSIIQAGLTALTAQAFYGIGRLFGGVSSFETSLRLVVWLQTILVGLQVIQIGFLLIFPPLAIVTGWVGMVLFFYLLTSFVQVAHGFSSGLVVFSMIVLSLFVVAMILGIVLPIEVIMPPQAS